MKVTQAYRFALDPTPSQMRALRSHAGAARFAWNWGLARCIERYGAEGRWYSAAELHRLWNVEKKADPALAWWVENSKCAYQEAFRNLDRALNDFIKSRRGERKGRTLGPGSALSAPTSPLASSPAVWKPGRRASCPPPFHELRSGGSSPSPSKSSVMCPPHTPGLALPLAST